MVGINVGYSDSAVSARSFVGGEEGTTDDIGLGDGLGMNNIWVVVELQLEGCVVGFCVGKKKWARLGHVLGISDGNEEGMWVA